MKEQRGGGSVGQSLQYVDPNAPERSAGAGNDLLVEHGLIARPRIGGGSRKRGGFFPSVMAGVVDNAFLTAPLAAIAGRKLLNRKTRKGGGKKGNVWKMQQEEAREILKEIAKPSARNVIVYAAARRRDPVEAEAFLEAFRDKKIREAEAFSAKRMAKEAEKERKRKEKEAEKEAKKKLKEAEKEAKRKLKEAEKAMKALTKKRKPAAVKPPAVPTRKTVKVVQPAKGQHLFFNDEGKEVVIQKPVVAKTARKTVKNNLAKTIQQSQAVWQSLMEKASKQLKEENINSNKDAKKLAALMKKGETIKSFLNTMQSIAERKEEKPAAKPKTVKTRKVNQSVTVKENKPKTAKTRKVNESASGKTQRMVSAKSQQYFDNLRTARETLSKYGKPTGPNMSAYVRMSRKGENMSQWLENFKSRRSLATLKTAKKVKATAAKPLSVIAEGEGENQNE